MAVTFTIRFGVEEDVCELQSVERDSAQTFASVGYDFCCTGPVRDRDEHIRGLNDGAILVAEGESVLSVLHYYGPLMRVCISLSYPFDKNTKRGELVPAY